MPTPDQILELCNNDTWRGVVPPKWTSDDPICYIVGREDVGFVGLMLAADLSTAWCSESFDNTSEAEQSLRAEAARMKSAGG